MFYYYMNEGMSAGIVHQLVSVMFRCYLFPLNKKKGNRFDQIIEKEKEKMFKHCLLQMSGKKPEEKMGKINSD